MPRLVVSRGRSKGQRLALPEQGVVVVGRELTTNLPIRDVQASRRHCRVVCDGEALKVEDLASANGTFLNGRRIACEPLEVGDKLRCGGTILFVLPDDQDDERGALSGGELAGYKIGKLLGRGGMGSVYEAQQLSLERKVALKVLAKELAEDDEFVQRFQREARSAGRLNHQNIVQVYDVGSSKGTYFYSMELMARGSVEDLLREHKKLSLGEVLPVAIDAARGLQYAEKRGLIHRDIKPANLFLSADGITKIGDLGIAQTVEVSGAKEDQETVSGSPNYIAPEQALGRAIDHRVDLYALGVSLFEMISGRLPFTGRTSQEIILKQVKEAPPSLLDLEPEIEPSFAAVVAALLQKEPTDRPGSASSLVDALVPLLDRHPAGGTTMIRLQADVSNSSSGRQLKAPIPQPEPGLSPELRGLSLAFVKPLLGVLVVLALGFGGRQFVKQKARERAVRDEALKGLRADLADGKGSLQELERSALELADRWSTEGHSEFAARAKRLAEAVETERDRRREAAWERKAAKRFADIQQRCVEPLSQHLEDADFLEAAAKQLRAFLKKFGASNAAPPARTANTQVLDALERYRDVAAQRQEQARQDKDALAELTKSVNKLCVGYLFGAALRQIESFKSEHPGGATFDGAVLMSAEVRGQARRALERLDSNLNRALYEQRYDESRRDIEALRAKVEMPELAGDFEAMLKKIEETRESAARAERERIIEADEQRLAVAREGFAPLLAERSFGALSRQLSLVANGLQLEAFKRRTRHRVAIYGGAHEALDLLVTHVKSKGRASGVTALFELGVEELEGVAVDGSERELVFELKRGVSIARRFEKFDAPGLLALFEGLSLEAEGALRLSALAWALGDEAFAKQQLELGRSAKGEEVASLLAALEAELR